MTSFRNKLVFWRIENDYTQEDIADMCNISTRTVQSWEHGKSLPGFDSLILIANTMDVSVDYLLGRSRHWKTIERFIEDGYE